MAAIPNINPLASLHVPATAPVSHTGRNIGIGIFVIIALFCIIYFPIAYSYKIWPWASPSTCNVGYAFATDGKTCNVCATGYTFAADGTTCNVCATGYTFGSDKVTCSLTGTTAPKDDTNYEDDDTNYEDDDTTPMGTTPMGTTPIGTTPIGTTPIGTTTTPPRFPPNTYVSTSESGGHWCGPSKDYLNPSSDLSLDDCKFKCYTHMSSSDFGQNPYRNCSAFNFDPIDSKIGKCRLYTSEKQEPTVKKSHLNHDEKCFIDPKMSSKVANSAYNMELLSGGHPGGKWLTGTLTDGL